MQDAQNSGAGLPSFNSGFPVIGQNSEILVVSSRFSADHAITICRLKVDATLASDTAVVAVY